MQHVVDFASPGTVLPAASGARALRVLVPVDGSTSALQGVRHVLGLAPSGRALDVHLVNVRTPFSQYLARFLSPRDRMAYHRFAGERALKGARRLLEQAGVSYRAHVELGPRAETVDRMAQQLQADQIVLGTARKNSLTRLLEDSLTAGLLRTTQVPVQVVPGGALPLLERALLVAVAAAMLAALL
ncbi:MAG: universal stress protein [Betaproteobacteria bacterium]|nr:universal stress protein [Betaproteobacteria bacterium]